MAGLLVDEQVEPRPSHRETMRESRKGVDSNAINDEVSKRCYQDVHDR
jgi:hypothetical protein